MTKLSSYRVLVVDDHPLQGLHLTSLLEADGFGQVDVTASAEVALTKNNTQPYHLILIDLNMPGMDGVQFIDKLAEQHHNTMLAIVSSYPRRIMNSVALMAKEKGLAVLGTFSKPMASYHVKQLATLLRKSTIDTDITPQQANQDALLDRDSLENALRTKQLCAWFQPKKSLASGQIVGAEALVRWQHPEFGFMLPGSFLADVHRHSLDLALLLRILDDAIDAHLRWSKEGYRVPVSVNLPTQLLDDSNLPDMLERIVLARGVAPQEISFELLENETTLTQGRYYMGASRLRLKGFKLAQDDFGRGYSSMHNLISTPFTELKIDRAFVNGASNNEDQAAALILSVQLGRQLGLQVTAEGVETINDLEFLRKIGCDCAQGFLISAAIDVNSFSRLLAQGRVAMDQPCL